MDYDEEAAGWPGEDRMTYVTLAEQHAQIEEQRRTISELRNARAAGLAWHPGDADHW